MMKENIYGHTKRLHWLVDNIRKNDLIIELGCGTGYMITLPLTKAGYTILGVDRDLPSINYGKKLFYQEGLNPEVLKAGELSGISLSPDVIIASEVLEHMADEDLTETLNGVYDKLKPSGRFLVTVPNGFGGFEIENFLWLKTGKGRLMELLRINRAVAGFKMRAFGSDTQMGRPPSSLSDSPHVQRFTYHSIQKLLNRHGFEITYISGTVFFAGPFSNLLFTGIEPVMRLNCILGNTYTKNASGFCLACIKSS